MVIPLDFEQSQTARLMWGKYGKKMGAILGQVRMAGVYGIDYELVLRVLTPRQAKKIYRALKSCRLRREK
jgi:hypothetical protein